uniref:HigA protein (Antitoxin to HigB) n=1 Tax=uncultured bacterium A1Q1_fos_1880 TaxID=1256556 RepID=L7VVH3_9BACT|nr:HigA protein (antitoxin to HigB) [uncultured bacterium A1Q1_fos_1880]
MVTADTALRLFHYFGTMPQFRMNLQSTYDLRLAEVKAGHRIRQEIATHPTLDSHLHRS